MNTPETLRKQRGAKMSRSTPEQSQTTPKPGPTPKATPANRGKHHFSMLKLVCHKSVTPHTALHIIASLASQERSHLTAFSNLSCKYSHLTLGACITESCYRKAIVEAAHLSQDFQKYSDSPSSSARLVLMPPSTVTHVTLFHTEKIP